MLATADEISVITTAELYTLRGACMQRYDRLGGLLWVAIGIAICVESIRLGTGSVSTPGPGLIPLGCGLLLSALGIALCIASYRYKHCSEKCSSRADGDILAKSGPCPELPCGLRTPFGGPGFSSGHRTLGRGQLPVGKHGLEKNAADLGHRHFIMLSHL